MSISAIDLVIDTNCFVQLRDLRDLPWGEILSDVSTVNLVVTEVVIAELDRMKTGGNRRLRDRSRAALALIEQAADEVDQRLVLKVKDRLEITLLLDDSLIDWTAFPTLNPARNDDQLVAVAGTRAATSDTRLLSHDSGPYVRARRLSMPEQIVVLGTRAS